ncbi:MAG: HNH endonuclease [Aeromicrobium sp.]|uniref:HNH endonuclease n=1 Tax=Aeromicrobium sp. TaxID=1871063 RepID=UPI0039E27FA6
MRDVLTKEQHDKCGWCERLLDDAAIEIDHIRPKSKQKYWWLAFEERNLLAACRSCNNKKRSEWPLLPGASMLSPRQLPWLVLERAAIVDPTVEDPSPHFVFLDLGGRWRVVGATERGRRTVEVLALDRDRLSGIMTARVRQVIQPVISAAEQAFAAGDQARWTQETNLLNEFCGPDAEFSGLARHLVREMVARLG